MSAETTGIPLVVRYNNRGQPDGLKEELNIIVNSVSANEYKGGSVPGGGSYYFTGLADTPSTEPNTPGSIISVDPSLTAIIYSDYTIFSLTALDENFYIFTSLALTSVGPQDLTGVGLGDLCGVTISSPQNNQVLVYDGTKWINGPVPISVTGPGATSFIQLPDTPAAYSVPADNGKLLYVIASDPATTGIRFSDYTLTTIGELTAGVESLTGSITALQNQVTSLDLEDLTIGGEPTAFVGPPPEANVILRYTGTAWDYSTALTTAVTAIETNYHDLTGQISYIDTNVTANYHSVTSLGGQFDAFDLVNYKIGTKQFPTPYTNPPNTNNIIKYDGTNWVFTSIPTNTGSTTLRDLTDTSISDPTLAGNFLTYDNAISRWKDVPFIGINFVDIGGGETSLQLNFSGLSSSGSTQGDLLAVGPSGTVINQSSLLPSINPAPLFEDIGKLIIINESADDLIESSALKWDYTSQGLQVLGDVSAQNYYGNITGATGEISNISGVSSIQFDINMPSEYVAVEGEVYYDSDAHTLSIQTGTDTTLQVGQEQVIRVRNETGDTITDGTVVYVSGTQGNGVAKLLIGKATASVEEVEQDIVGIATQDIAHNSDGFITTFGVVRNISTAGTTVGDIIYLSTSAGKFTNVAPQAPNHTIKLGIVLRVHQNDGAVFVKVDPGFDLANLHDVSVQGIQSGDLLRWNGTIFAPSAYDHGTLGGLADDDHTQYVIKSNTTQARNTIQPTTDVPALTLQAGLSNTGRLLEIKNSLTQTVAYITIDGTIVTDGGLNVAGSKAFLIDHPTKEGMKLQYACLEGPENGVYVRGRATSEVIDLPDYWVGLVHEDSITVTLTPVGSAQSDLYVANIADNKVHLVRESNQPIDCFYIVNATRKDLENLVVEFSK